MGLSLDSYWNLTPRQFNKYIDVYVQKEKNRMIENDFLNHLLGRYVAFAVNRPKDYPKKPILAESNDNKEMTAEKMEEAVKKITLKLGGKI